MKILRFLLLLIFAIPFANAATVTLTFTGNNPPGSVEYFAEELQPDNTTWLEAIKGPTSPLVVANAAPGNHSYRVKARLTGVTATTGAGVSSPSNTAVTGVPPNAPTGLNYTITAIFKAIRNFFARVFSHPNTAPA